jgi:hypothetical protein
MDRVAWWGACVGFDKAVGMPKPILSKKCNGWYFIGGMKWVHVPCEQSELPCKLRVSGTAITQWYKAEAKCSAFLLEALLKSHPS